MTQAKSTMRIVMCVGGRESCFIVTVRTQVTQGPPARPAGNFVGRTSFIFNEFLNFFAVFFPLGDFCCIAAGVGQLLLWCEGPMIGCLWLLALMIVVCGTFDRLSYWCASRWALLLIISCCDLRLTVGSLGAEAPVAR